ncbi:MAG: hypothetical protein ABIJ57_00425, partial [Pseudomonadota bacterium]
FGLITGPFGAYLGNLIADITNSRDFETLLDVYEDMGYGYGVTPAFGAYPEGYATHYDAGLDFSATGAPGWGAGEGWGDGGFGGDGEASDGSGGDAGTAGGEGWLKGTGPEGLPYTGRFLGHEGEVVLNPRESQAYREGARKGGGSDKPMQVNVYLGNELIHSDMYRVADNVRVKAERGRSSQGMKTRRIYS